MLVAPLTAVRSSGFRAGLGRLGRRLTWTFLLATGLLSAPARATVVERVVAVVGEDAVWMSDLRGRAVPYLLRIQQEIPNASQRAATISQLYKTLVERLVEEALLQNAARQANITVKDEDVQQALERVAEQNGISLAALLAEARSGGLTDNQYREELRRQILDARLVNLRLQARVQVREEDLQRVYRAAVLTERKRLGFEAAWIVLDPGADQISSSRLAEILAKRARSGESFAELAKTYSADPGTRVRGGSLGKLRPGELPPHVDRVVVNLEVGEVSTPIRKDGRVYLVKVLSRDPSQLPSYEDAKGQLAERLYGEKMSKARARWLNQLRHQTHVEIRL